jgi:hypothetical protein
LILKDPVSESRGDSPSGRSGCSAAIATTLDQRGHWVVPESPDRSRMIDPGHPESSAVLRRIKSRSPISQMPPIGTVIADRAAVELLTAWVNNAEEWKRLRETCAAGAGY